MCKGGSTLTLHVHFLFAFIMLILFRWNALRAAIRGSRITNKTRPLEARKVTLIVWGKEREKVLVVYTAAMNPSREFSFF